MSPRKPFNLLAVFCFTLILSGSSLCLQRCKAQGSPSSAVETLDASKPEELEQADVVITLLDGFPPNSDDRISVGPRITIEVEIRKGEELTSIKNGKVGFILWSSQNHPLLLRTPAVTDNQGKWTADIALDNVVLPDGIAVSGAEFDIQAFLYSKIPDTEEEFLQAWKDSQLRHSERVHLLYINPALQMGGGSEFTSSPAKAHLLMSNFTIDWEDGESPDWTFEKEDVHLAGTVSKTLSASSQVWLGRCQRGKSEWEFVKVLVDDNNSWKLSRDVWPDLEGEYAVIAIVSDVEIPPICTQAIWQEKATAISTIGIMHVVPYNLPFTWQQTGALVSLWMSSPIFWLFIAILLAVAFVAIRRLKPVGMGEMGSNASIWILEGSRQMNSKQRREKFIGWLLLVLLITAIIKYFPFYSGALKRVLNLNNKSPISMNEARALTWQLILVGIITGILLECAWHHLQQSGKLSTWTGKLLMAICIVPVGLLCSAQAQFQAANYGASQAFGICIGIVFALAEVFTPFVIIHYLLRDGNGGGGDSIENDKRSIDSGKDGATPPTDPLEEQKQPDAIDTQTDFARAVTATPSVPQTKEP